ncbi:MAG: cytochrome c3 family protein [Desulfonatronovibrionaceae bacterium]
MKKSLIVTLACTTLIGVFMLSNLYATDVPDELTIQPPEEVNARKSAVDFSHDSHEDIDCTKCHHMWDGESDIQPCMDSGCHDIVKPNPKERRSIEYYYNAYHDMCYKGCHMDQKKAGEPTGPTSCNGCHPKE